ncbi:MAG: type I-F CRISPR-associated helicase Cas3f [Formosimonas sp.]
MMVTFISQCEKKALSRTRRVLDAFADRIGSNTWQTIITEEGLIAVKKLLRQTATKNTAVACHWMRSRSRSELVWVVGNRRKFNSEGIVPVNNTKTNHQHNEWENDWVYLPAIKALTAVAALLHDWGKASVLFQQKLRKSTKQGDPLRHEWVSCLLLNALITQSGDSTSDAAWLDLLGRGQINETQLVELVVQNNTHPLDNLPPIAQLVAWLIVTHHRLPSLHDKTKLNGFERNNISAQLKSISAEWGYQKQEFKERQPQCFEFKQGVLSDSVPWRKAIKKWVARLADAQPQIVTAIDNGAWRVMVLHARLCLMLGDHYYSSCEQDSKWQSTIELYANTARVEGVSQLKQKLDEHLVRVSEHALNISQSLSRFSSDMTPAYDIKNLSKKSPPAFEWQDLATSKINAFKQSNPQFTQANAEKNGGWFIVNMASTGCGKTIANAKIMRALSEDGKSLRFILALGLRTLTLQTGDEYRNSVGLEKDELAVLIGSAAVKELHDKNQQGVGSAAHDVDLTNEALGSESADFLLDEELDFEDAPTAEFLNAIIPPQSPAKNKAFLYKPVLVCTIDHMMAATETTRGGRYILPYLRLLSSDLVIDEVDDFDGKDLIAIARLIHLAGMLGRKVMISSATIPPALAEGFFNAYQEGWRVHQAFKNTEASIACVWVDEFSTHIHSIVGNQSLARCGAYQEQHQKFIKTRVQKITQAEKTTIKRKAQIVRCDDIINHAQQSSKQADYFERIQNTIIELHHAHHTIDAQTGKRVSFGVVRVANIPPCVALTQYLLNADWPEQVAPKAMAYHSRQVLLLRSHQENHLDQVLKRKEKKGEAQSAFSNPVIRAHLNQGTATDVIFILVATPVEEVGRDHDFDWAVIEPSSYRSIIQLAGRVRRHRNSGVDAPNIAIMQYNLKGLAKGDQAVFCRPGFEKNHMRLNQHHMDGLVDEQQLQHSLNAIPRIEQPAVLDAHNRLVDLEHQVISDSLKSYGKKGPESLQAWLSESWWLTALPQQINRFRESTPDISLYRVWQNGKAIFCEKNESGQFLKNNVGDLAPWQYSRSINHVEPMSEQAQSRLWLARDYATVLQQYCDSEGFQGLSEQEQQTHIRRASQRYGEITVPDNDTQRFEYSDNFGLVVKR